MSKRSVRKAKQTLGAPSFKELVKAGQNKETVLTEADIEVVEDLEPAHHEHGESCNH